MIELKNRLLSTYRKIVGSIAFYPSVIATGMAIGAVLVLALEQRGATAFLQEHLHVLIIYSQDTARVILSTLMAGVISLTVFSFSMVMILLNQASSYFSPRLLPGLISNKGHQFVLGTYLGTILYCLLVLINIYKPDDDARLPGFAILLAIGLGIFCLGQFIYFIHNISTSIQASNVLQKIFRDTRHHLLEMQQNDRRLLSKNEGFEFPETPHEVFSPVSGYFQDIAERSLLKIATEHDFVIRLKTTRGMYVLRDLPLAATDRKLSEEVLDEVRSCFQFSNQELVRDNYVLGIKQMTEVAVKAMSPGINDPGTALTAIDFLADLLAIRLTISDHEWATDDDGNRRVVYQAIRFKELAFNVLSALRQYVKHDTVIVQKLLIMLNYLLAQKDLDKRYQSVLLTEKKALLEDAKRHIGNPHDWAAIENLAETGTKGN